MKYETRPRATPFDAAGAWSDRPSGSKISGVLAEFFPDNWLYRPAIILPDVAEEDFFETILQVAPTNSVLLCKRAGAHAFQEKATLSWRTHVEVQVCVDLPRALEALAALATKPAVFVQSDVVRGFVDGAARNTLQMTRTLGGYDIDFSILSDVSATLLCDVLNPILSARTSPVVFHSGLSLLPPLLLRNHSDDNDPASDQADDGEWHANAFVKWEGEVIEPDLASVKQHAKFLVETDDPTLRSMHRQILEGPFHRVVAVWRSNLLALHEVEGAGSHGAEAARRLAALTA